MIDNEANMFQDEARMLALMHYVYSMFGCPAVFLLRVGVCCHGFTINHIGGRIGGPESPHFSLTPHRIINFSMRMCLETLYSPPTFVQLPLPLINHAINCLLGVFSNEQLIAY